MSEITYSNNAYIQNEQIYQHFSH